MAQRRKPEINCEAEQKILETFYKMAPLTSSYVEMVWVFV